MSTPDGGPAFPQVQHGEIQQDDRYVEKWWPEGGMSLRDYFAGQVIAAIYTQSVASGLDTMQEHLAQEAYELADELLKARGPA